MISEEIKCVHKQWILVSFPDPSSLRGGSGNETKWIPDPFLLGVGVAWEPNYPSFSVSRNNISDKIK